MIITKADFYILLTAGILFSSCGPTRTVSFNITRPAEITFPSDVNTILLVDRTKFSDDMFNILEGLITGELPADDKIAAQMALINLKNKLSYSPRFNVKIYPERLVGNSMTVAFPQPLSWDKIDQLCADNASQIVVCLEVFDSDFIITHGIRNKKKSIGVGTEKREVDYKEFYAQGVGSINMGIRAYYNREKVIVDEQMISLNNSWEGTGSTPMDALAMLVSKSNANKHLAGEVGQSYAYKISPLPIRISRPFFGKSRSVPELAKGTRYADVNNWDRAIAEWKAGFSDAKPKDAGKLAYNIAIAYEVLGEYGQALTWAQDSYAKYGNNLGRDYVRRIETRINEEIVLRKQMSE